MRSSKRSDAEAASMMVRVCARERVSERERERDLYLPSRQNENTKILCNT